LLRDHARRHSVPGAVVGVLREDEVEIACFGVADTRTGERVTAETRFAIGSLGKSMLATALALSGVPFEDPVTAHVPELRETAWAQGLTLRDLLANLGRIPLTEGLSAGLGEGDDVVSRLVARIAGEPQAGAFWSYSNAGWCILGRALETISGQVWEEALQTTLLDPLALGQTTFANYPAEEPRASGHSVSAEGVVPAEAWAPRAVGPAGATLLSTAGDLLLFARRHLEDSALEPLRETQADVTIHGWLDAWCLGWARFDWSGGPVWGWDGVIGGFRSALRLVPHRKGAVVLLTNSASGRALYRSLFPELLKGFGVVMPPLRLEESPGAAGDLSRYVGGYATPDERWEVTAAETSLVIDGPDGRQLAAPIEDCVFLLDPDEPDAPTVTFGELDASGRPQVLYQMIWAIPRA
jgi:CubicO group peptidase (beta-lactamase class C family)